MGMVETTRLSVDLFFFFLGGEETSAPTTEYVVWFGDEEGFLLGFPMFDI